MGSESFDTAGFAADLQRIIKATADSVSSNGKPNSLVDKVTGHLGLDLPTVTMVAQHWANWEHANLQRGVDAYLSEQATPPDWFGISGGSRGHDDLIGLLSTARRFDQHELGTVDFTIVAIGPDEVTEAVQLGLAATTAPDGSPVVLSVRGPDMQFSNQQTCRLEVLAADRATATAVRDRVEQLMVIHDVFRGQVLSFGFSESRGNSLLTFLDRPQLRPEDVVLPDGVLDLIERHTIGIAEHSERLLAAGQHLKRGLLLHGPPGTGKTHTVHYLMGRLPQTTVIVLTGAALNLIDRAATLARRLQPSIVVLEDVDLVAQDRGFTPMGNPALFSLLDAMDGIGRDADVIFLLTTNRADDLERALADRPGRVDLAVEIPRPDATGRAALLRLYGRGLSVAADLDPIVEASAGQTASFIKELLRRAALRAITARPDAAETVIEDRDLSEALIEMNDARATLTRALLGGKGAEAAPLMPQPPT